MEITNKGDDADPAAGVRVTLTCACFKCVAVRSFPACFRSCAAMILLRRSWGVSGFGAVGFGACNIAHAHTQEGVRE